MVVPWRAEELQKLAQAHCLGPVRAAGGAPVFLLLVFRFLPVPGTPEMLLSLVEGKGAHYAWSDDINPVLGRTVIGSEDQNFCSHHGFDFKQLDQVMEDYRRHPDRPPRGASTLSQQTPAPCSWLPCEVLSARDWKPG